jgi:hypothetical protein
LSDTFSTSVNQFNLGYTDFTHPMVDYGNSQFDNRHRIAISAFYAPSVRAWYEGSRQGGS